MSPTVAARGTGGNGAAGAVGLTNEAAHTPLDSESAYGPLPIIGLGPATEVYPSEV